VVVNDVGRVPRADSICRLIVRTLPLQAVTSHGLPPRCYRPDVHVKARSGFAMRQIAPPFGFTQPFPYMWAIYF
jgi:hypothetical protein